MRLGIPQWYFWSRRDEPDIVPSLGFLPVRARRRLSLLSRMTLEAGHSLCADSDVQDVVFSSRYGEIARQLEITEGILDDGEVSPSAFSYSVFNTPVALLSLHEKLKGKTRAVYAGEESFVNGLMQSVLSTGRRQGSPVLYLYADEEIPDAYQALVNSAGPAFCFGLRLSVPGDSTVQLELLSENGGHSPSTDDTRTTDDSSPEGVARSLAGWLAEPAGEYQLQGPGYTLRFERVQD